jgi:hypothetical protein
MFQLLFTCDGFVDVEVMLVPNQHPHPILGRESRSSAGPMLMRAPREIVGHADVKRTIRRLAMM